MFGIRAADVEKALENIMQVECWRIFAIPALSLDERGRAISYLKQS